MMQLIKTLFFFNFILFVNVQLNFAEVKMNQNKVTDYFEKEVRDQDNIKRDLEQSNKNFNSNSSQKTMDFIGVNNFDAENNAKVLNRINPHELAAQGQLERSKNNELNKYLDNSDINLSSENLARQKQDIDLIVNATDKLADKIGNIAKNFGVDCFKQKGNIQQDAKMYLQIEEIPHSVTIHEKAVCEKLRNNYTCKNILNLRCKKRGIISIAKSIAVSLDEFSSYTQEDSDNNIWVNVEDWRFYGCYGGDKITGLKLYDHNAQYIMRSFISGKTNTSIEKILNITNADYGYRSAKDNGRLFPYPYYVSVLYYNLNQGEECQEWEENWDEICTLK